MAKHPHGEHDQPAPPPDDPEGDLIAALARLDRRAELRELTVLAYAQGFTSWLYRVPPGHEIAVLRAGYFDDAKDMLALGDLLALRRTNGCVMLRSVVGLRPTIIVPTL